MGIDKKIKCVVWDLDNTLWKGILSEDKEVTLRTDIPSVIKTLDQRGVLLSIASKNSYDDAIEKLKQFELDEFFLFPQIGWQPKSEMIDQIRKNLNIGLDTMMFIDDDNFELEEVSFSHPQVYCMNSKHLETLLDNNRLKSEAVTEDSKKRRLMYQQEIQRTDSEKNFNGSKQEFLKCLNMKFIISNAREEDLIRAEELTNRTNQLNSTGIMYGKQDLQKYINSSKHKILICELTDKFGSYGKIGLVLIDLDKNIWHIRLLLMSCRVISRGLGSILLTYIMQQAKLNKKVLRADFKETGKNRMMYLTYKFNNFKEISSDGENVLLENNLENIQSIPDYIEVLIN